MIFNSIVAVCVFSVLGTVAINFYIVKRYWPIDFYMISFFGLQRKVVSYEKLHK